MSYLKLPFTYIKVEFEHILYHFAPVQCANRHCRKTCYVKAAAMLFYDPDDPQRPWDGCQFLFMTNCHMTAMLYCMTSRSKRNLPYG
ncbi:predicted protein [Lichtheimia corymbifera JMRC:FSU:9682]|uniref:Uncharacterized protein n=1 Tax=Lichtheimia corymbifera JMRC:FSU:9682 TaxID=1263082 RepID=A0A068RHG1_9FUNG|nr:predicted protein [Lichtheimia corymbifera JMRC:FSU:9682]